MIDVKIRALKLRSAGRCAIAMALVCVASAALAHDDHGHEHPLRLPPLGPHGGRHAALGIHHVEFSASGNRACFYFLEPDMKTALDEGLQPEIQLEERRRAPRRLALVRDGDCYEASLQLPRSTRRVLFHVRVEIEGQWEHAVLLYEPRPWRAGP